MLSTGVRQAPIGSAQDLARWKVTGEEHGSILGILTLRHLNDTLSTSPFGQKESIDILGKYLKY